MQMLSYISQSQLPEAGREAALDQLVMQSQSRNLKDDVTGVLFLRGNVFFQTIEGPSEVINATYDRIKADPRHKGLYLIMNEPIEERRFDDWSLESFQTPETTLDVMCIMHDLGRYLAETRHFSPYGIAAFSLRMMNDLTGYRLAGQIV